ncbi:DUF814 domain-containing protein [Candidatus Woesearchaeota archaeon]|nr:DUF814 domain-containing protein [Candidatus Woesearchaeota archaeon]
MKIVLDVRKSVDGNAAGYFEKAKKARKKLEGAKSALERTREKLQNLISEQELAQKKSTAEAEERKSASSLALGREWFEKFRWFISSEGFLCIGGRDATTNEIIIKKHTGSTDLVFHTELAGSPFFVVKSGSHSGSIGAATIEEAAIATASYSRAWKAGLQSADVYWVRPEQVSKEAKSGEYISKGAFMIYGKKNVVPVRVELAIGLLSNGKLMGGPAAAAAKNCAKHVKLLQGDNKPSDAAKKIAKILGLSSNKGSSTPPLSTLGKSYIDEIIRAMPAGEFKVLSL